jgi:hypothetical protein
MSDFSEGAEMTSSLVVVNSHQQLAESAAASAASAPVVGGAFGISELQIDDVTVGVKSHECNVVTLFGIPSQKTNEELQGILNYDSRYPRSPSSDDVTPIRMAETGPLRNYTKDKFGHIIPYEHCFYFTNLKYEEKARCAQLTHAMRRAERMKLLLVEKQQSRLQQMATLRSNGSDKTL